MSGIQEVKKLQKLVQNAEVLIGILQEGINQRIISDERNSGVKEGLKMRGNSTKRTNMLQNGVKKQDILKLAQKYPLQTIECAIIKKFLQNKKIFTIKNKLISNIISQEKQETKIINDYLELNSFEYNLKNIEKVFELLIPNEDKKLNGAVYTPTFLVDYIINNCIFKKETITICDPACGSGAFLVEAVKRYSELNNKGIIKTIEENIFGVDISENGIKHSKIILSLLALENGEDLPEIKFNLKISDSLSIDWKKEFPEVFKKGGFDVVIGNPPYVRAKNLPEKLRTKLHANWETVKSGNVDLFIPFIELGTKIINKQGILGYVIPNGFLTSFSARELRDYLKFNKYLKKILDFNHLQLFQDAMTYVCIAIMDKQQKESFEYGLIDTEDAIEKINEKKFTKIDYKKLQKIEWRLLNGKHAENIKRIENSGIILSQVSKITTGIATLRNDLFILNNPEKIGNYYIKEVNNERFRIEEEITKEAINAGRVQNTTELMKNKDRLIFPYKLIKDKYILIPEIELKKKFPCCYKFLTEIKPLLAKRDKGKKKYADWYAYGRTQGLRKLGDRKLIIPTISNKPKFILCPKDAIVYAGYELYSDRNLDFLSKILNSGIMWYYIKKTSKPYASGYMSFAKNFIKNFSIPNFSKEEANFLEKENNANEINSFLIKKYDLNLNLSDL